MAMLSNNGSTNKDEKLVTLFYLLMRDSVQTGEFVRIIQMINESYDNTIFIPINISRKWHENMLPDLRAINSVG